MRIQIRHRYNYSVLFECEADSMKIAVKLAIKAKANLSGANLFGANLSRANLYGADLSWADLSRANLLSADLSRADLLSADLSGADLSGANLYGANLSRANLFGANLSGANLLSADLSRADLLSADLSGANIDFSCWPLWCGSKKVKVDIGIVYQLIAHLCVLECDDKIFKRVQKFLLPFAKKFHRWGELSS